ncbi:DeoR/GlpR family DNA-binding transcription regulator [Roseomonas elaeocarpi]|uniref:DeoR/GlpR family DNA-binding transcription regulator n=1 Tax=Roseomonas elaeocarpi TaxID=907779 RepID=A0ABV6K248_9PROT
MSGKVEARHGHILGLIRQRGYASNDELARQLQVTVQTIRRDVNLLAEEGLVTRHHGGAGLVSSVENIAYAERQVLNLPEKRAIARLAAAEIPNRSSVFLNIGTTTEAVAHALLRHEDLRVITNNLNVASLLARETRFPVIVAGGSVRHHDGGITGPWVSEMIEGFRADYGIIGISGIDEDGTLLDFDEDEVRAARAIMRSAREVFLVTTHAKFGRRPLVRLGHVRELTALFTDRAPPPGITAMLREHGVRLRIAEMGRAEADGEAEESAPDGPPP